MQLRWQNPDNNQVTEINGNFNTWDLASSFESADAYYQHAVIVGYYAERLRLSPWTFEIPMSWMIEHASRIAGQLPADKEISQFVSLVSRAAQIRGPQPVNFYLQEPNTPWDPNPGSVLHV